MFFYCCFHYFPLFLFLLSFVCFCIFSDLIFLTFLDNFLHFLFSIARLSCPAVFLIIIVSHQAFVSSFCQDILKQEFSDTFSFCKVFSLRFFSSLRLVLDSLFVLYHCSCDVLLCSLFFDCLSLRLVFSFCYCEPKFFGRYAGFRI